MTDNQNLKNAEIAEMAKVIKPVMPYDGCGKDLQCHFKANDEIDCPGCSIANALYNAGYRKVVYRNNMTELLDEEIKELLFTDKIRKETAKEILIPLQKFLIEKFDYFGALAKRNEEANSENRLFDLGEQDMANCTIDVVKDLLRKHGVAEEE